MGASSTSNRLIGASVSRSGRFTAAGSLYEHAYQLWADQLNARGGLLGSPVQLELRDDESLPEKAADNYRRLLDDGIALLLGPSHTVC